MTLPATFHVKHDAACPLCAADGPLYDHNRLCCHVRLLLKEPRREVRQAWLRRVAGRSGALAAAIKAELAEHWQARKEAA